MEIVFISTSVISYLWGDTVSVHHQWEYLSLKRILVTEPSYSGAQLSGPLVNAMHYSLLCVWK
jgi:hypothetical protein